MKIEEVEALAIRTTGFPKASELFDVIDQALSALRAEAWHPIEKAAELGVKSFRRVVLQESSDWFTGYLLAGKWYDSTGTECFPAHFRFINPPEGS